MSAVLLITASFLACSVEMVEALTIVLAVGTTNSWRSAITGVVAALLALTVVVAVLGPSLVEFVPIHVLQVFVGGLLLIFGMQWLRKAILRASGLKAQHDEDAIFRAEVADLEAVPKDALDWTAFVLSFKGVFLEGLEVAFIVLTFGTSAGRFTEAVAGAVLAVLVVGAIGMTLRAPLSRVPENNIKFVVGVLLTAFGTFWGGEGVGIEWRLEDAMIIILAALYAGVAFGLVALLKRRQPAPVPPKLTVLEG